MYSEMHKFYSLCEHVVSGTRTINMLFYVHVFATLFILFYEVFGYLNSYGSFSVSPQLICLYSKPSWKISDVNRLPNDIGLVNRSRASKDYLFLYNSIVIALNSFLPDTWERNCDVEWLLWIVVLFTAIHL